MKFSVDMLRVLRPEAPEKSLQELADAFNKYARQYGVTSSLRAAALLGQLMKESSLQVVEENLFYTTPERLMRVFSSRFKTAQQAQPYLRNPEGLANLVYANRLGNGGVQSGDGWRFRGRGLIQTTGRSNYAQASQWTGVNLLADPDLLMTVDVAVEAALAYWESRKCNEMADRQDFEGITRAINGNAMLGHQDRVDYARKVLVFLEQRKPEPQVQVFIPDPKGGWLEVTGRRVEGNFTVVNATEDGKVFIR